MKIVFRVLGPGFLAAALSAGCLAQAYPGKTVRVIVPFPPGGSNDIVARVVFQKMSDITGQQHVIDNRGGAAGTIGAALAAKAPSDGYTVMVHSVTLISNAHMRKKLPYDTLNDFVAVTPLAEQVFMLAVHPSLPVKSVRELVALAKKRPGEIFYSTGGNGTPPHLAMALFESMTAIKMVHVQYKGGAPAVVALLVGEVQTMAANIGVAETHIKTGRLRALGVTSAQRVAQFPDVPSVGEAVPGYDFTGWVAAFVPTGTPAAIVRKLNGDLGKAIADPGVTASLARQTLTPMYRSPEDAARFFKAEYEKTGKLIRATGARVD